MKILLINPPLALFAQEFISIVPPLGLAYIAAVLEKEGHEVKILDCLALSCQLVKSHLRDFQPEIVGLSNLVFVNEQEVVKLAKLVKRWQPQTKVIVGGTNASARWQVLIKEKAIDWLAIGEGEMTMKELAGGKNLRQINGLVWKNSQGQAVVNSPRQLMTDLDQLPLPAWHLLPMEAYSHGHPAGYLYKKNKMGFVLSSRGCPFGCNFCTNESLWQRKWRPRSVANVIAEIKLLQERYGIEEIQFMDSNISVDKKRLRELCSALKKIGLPWIPYPGVGVATLDPALIRLLADSGCYALQFGIEHGDPTMQKRIGKIVSLKQTRALVSECQKVGIWAHGYFIVGLPGETMATAYSSLDFALKANFDSVSFFTALPLPGSRLYQEVFGKKPVSLGNLRIYYSAVRCSALSLKQMRQVIKDSFRRFLWFKIRKEISSGQWWRRLSWIRSTDDLRFYWRFIKRFFQLEAILS